MVWWMELKEVSWSWRVGGAGAFLSEDGVLEGKEDSHHTTTKNEKMNGLEDGTCGNEKKKKKKELWKSP